MTLLGVRKGEGRKEERGRKMEVEGGYGGRGGKEDENTWRWLHKEQNRLVRRHKPQKENQFKQF